jgi:hypothetical protein
VGGAEDEDVVYWVLEEELVAMMSVGPFWRIVTPPREREMVEASFSEGVLGSMFCGRLESKLVVDEQR